MTDITKDLQIKIGKKISEIRLRNNQTQHDIESICGIDAAEVSKYENGKRNLTLKTLTRFALALAIHPQELFDFDFDLKHYKINE